MYNFANQIKLSRKLVLIQNITCTFDTIWLNYALLYICILTVRDDLWSRASDLWYKISSNIPSITKWNIGRNMDSRRLPYYILSMTALSILLARNTMLITTTYLVLKDNRQRSRRINAFLIANALLNLKSTAQCQSFRVVICLYDETRYCF